MLLVEIFVVSMVVLLTGFGFYRLIRAERDARRYLEGRAEAPLQLTHLSGALAQVARETRTLRISLESPLRALREFMQVDLTRTEDDALAVDGALLEATRAIGEWLAMIEDLPEQERGALSAMGASPAPIRAAVDAEHGAFERRNLHQKGRPDLDTRLEAILKELGRIEAAMQVQVGPYR